MSDGVRCEMNVMGLIFHVECLAHETEYVIFAVYGLASEFARALSELVAFSCQGLSICDPLLGRDGHTAVGICALLFVLVVQSLHRQGRCV